MSRVLRAVKMLGCVVMVALVVTEIVLAVGLYVVSHTGYRFLIITGGSMEPTYALGSALLIKELPADEVRPGTVVTFRSVDGTLTTHRVMARHRINGHDYVQTKGDANPGADPNFAPVDSVIGTPRFEIPAGGFTASFLLSPAGRMLVYAPPLVVLLVVEMRILRHRLRRPAPVTSLPDTLPVVDGCFEVPVRIRKAPNVLVPVIVAAVMASSVATGLFVARSNALFVASRASGANTFTSAALVAPTGVNATVGGGSTVTVAWTPTSSTAATGYTVYRATTSGGPYTSLGSVVGRSTGTFNDTTATGTVFYVVRSTVGNWMSPNSNQTSVSVAAWLNTGWLNCAANAADTGGDGNGFEITPANACSNPDGVVAQDKQTGTNNVVSCTDTGKDRHRFYNYGITVPSTATIGGIEVQTVGQHDKNGQAMVCIQLSNDGGTTWATPQSATYAGVKTTETLSYGGSSDLWGLSWTPAAMVNGKFMVRVINADSSSARTFDLDSIQVRVTYR